MRLAIGIWRLANFGQLPVASGQLPILNQFFRLYVIKYENK
jgi:hypothetical protein